jgi:trimeric autotransporter adhesin
MSGGAGNDVYLVNSSGDIIIEGTDQGIDLIRSLVDFSLGANIENLEYIGFGNFTANGNSLNNNITGGGGADTLNGGAGNDALAGGSGNDLLDGGTGDDILVLSGVETDYTFTVVNTTQFKVTDNRVGGGDGQDIFTNFEFVQFVTSGPYAYGLDFFLPGPRTITGTSLDDNNLNGGIGNDTINGLAGNDRLMGGAGNDQLNGGDGNDLLFGGAGADVIDGGAGVDRVDFNYTSVGMVVDRLNASNNTGEAFGDTYISIEEFSLSGFNDVFVGNADNETIYGWGGADTMSGGAGNDTYWLDRDTDVVVEQTNNGIDTIVTDFSYNSFALQSNVENLTMVRGFNAIGNSVDNIIVGNALVNEVTGGGGNDTIDGGAGTDTLVLSGLRTDYTFTLIDGLTTRVTDARLAGDGQDTFVNMEFVRFSNGTFALTNLVNSVNLTGTALGETLTGGVGADTLTGLGGNDLLIGGMGVDTLVGGLGNDTYVYLNADAIVELVGEGTDTIQSDVSLSLVQFDNVENLTLTGLSDLIATGNSLNNTLTGNSGWNTLDGGSGADTMIGGDGWDTYFVDSALDVVIESNNTNLYSNNDTVNSTISYTLGQNVENLVLTGLAASNATGNDLNNKLTGNGANNIINGGLGADTMAGGAGDDVYYVDNVNDSVIDGEGNNTVYASVDFDFGGGTLVLLGDARIGRGSSAVETIIGNALDNTIDGYGGADVMTGGGGNDLYYVDSTLDVVTELVADGTDTVVSTATFALSANVENLTLAGAVGINGTGNSSNNNLTGNAANNVIYGLAGNDILDGRSGSDTLVGGLGDDIYIVESNTDVVTELLNEGLDTVRSTSTFTLGDNVENLILFGASSINGSGNASNNIITGNSSDNTLIGLAGNDTLDGGDGADTLVGGVGDDTYIVNDASDLTVEVAGEGVDTVISSHSHTLQINVENLQLSGVLDSNAIGNSSQFNIRWQRK